MVLIYPLHRMNGGEAALFIAGLGSSIAWPILTRGQEFPSIGQMAQCRITYGFASYVVDSDRARMRPVYMKAKT